ncbi:BON domain-containing protein [Enhydrobacter aerosaccus]|uniref:BON domain-containing protein n=1 Tax=Enhydrobacter aerosaccus TaxID=225324 RepID=A0A1T4TG13_9HYPH|nr:CBS domain-containing protein [Enhydrobacter aerosaccus]SKA39149.1 BON domain-containing protein [Enhydrobacter aerosaccus]
MLAKDVMSVGVMSVKSDATILDTAALMVRLGVSALPVLDGDGLMLGIVTEADLMPFAALEPAPNGSAGGVLRSRRVTEVMTRDVISVEEDTPLKDIVALMTAKNIKRVPVRRGKAIVGMLSRMDLMRAIAIQGGATETRPLVAEDKDLRATVFHALRGRSWSNAMNFDVAVDRGDVHLWGVISSEEEHLAYRKAAEAVPGVKSVVSHMHVSGIIVPARS